MSLLDTVLEYNRSFVGEKKFERFRTDKLPNKRYVVITCMDARLVELLPASMDIHNGDVIMLKTGGAVISHPFGSIMRSILVAVYDLGAEEIFLVGHHDCGMGKVNSKEMIKKMLAKGISSDILETIDACGIDLESWLRGFNCVEDSVKNGVRIIRNNPLLGDIPVHGLVIDPDTGSLKVLEKGYKTVVV